MEYGYRYADRTPERDWGEPSWSMPSRIACRCSSCGEEIQEGERAYRLWTVSGSAVICTGCVTEIVAGEDEDA